MDREGRGRPRGKIMKDVMQLWTVNLSGSQQTEKNVISRCTKLENECGIFKNLYKSRGLSLSLKLWHYNKVVRPFEL